MEEIEIIFISDNDEVKIKCHKNENIKDIFEKYKIEAEKTNKSLDFFYAGNKINEELKLENINNFEKEIIINVKEKKLNNFIKSSAPVKIVEMKQSKDLICPICKKTCVITFHNYKFTLNKCNNEYKHNIENKLLSEYERTQTIQNKIKNCNQCQNKNDNLYNNKFYHCLSCKMELCSLCRSKHNEKHVTVDQEFVDYKCKNHGKSFISYCEECENNLCDLCEKEHDKKHRIIYFKKMIPNYDIRTKLNELREMIDKFKDNIKSIIDKMNTIINNIEIYYNINNDIIKSYERKNKNYQIYKNVENINKYNKVVIGNIKQILDEESDKNKIEYIDNMFKKITKVFGRSKTIRKKNDNKPISNPNPELRNVNTIIESKIYKENKDDITIEYKIPKNINKIIIFGNEFIKNNRDTCKIYINNKLREFSQNLDLNTCQIENEILKIKLRHHNIINMSSMFSGCKYLYSLPDIHKLKTDNVTKMNNLFSNCESLTSISDISEWDMSNVTDISYMFNGCKSLLSLPHISKWKTTNLLEMRNIFSGCKSLKSLPDISKWNISKVTNLSYLFSDCYSLKTLPNISKWDIKNVTDINHMFNNCFCLEILPDISNWNTSNINNMINLFSGCKCLVKLPDISKWDISKVNNLISVFASCEALQELPDISKWKTGNVIDMSKVFYNCYNLISLPDISEWKTENVNNMSHMFYYCQSVEAMPDISKWNTSNVTDMNNMFCGCDTLTTFPDISGWNIKKVTNMGYMFANCYSLKVLPDISKWNISKNTNIEQMFYYAKEDIVPNIKKKDDGCLII